MTRRPFFRILSLLLLLTLVFSLFTGCKKEEAPSLSFMETSTLPKNTSPNDPEYYYDAVHAELLDYEEILSVLSQGEETQLLCYNNKGSFLVTLDQENQIKSAVPTPIERTRLAYYSGEQLISVAKTKNTQGVYCYHVYRDNQVLWEFPDLRNLEISQVLEVDGTIYSYFKSTSDIPDEKSLKDSIYINNYCLPIPEDTADGKRYKLYGISEFDGIVYALLQEYQPTGPDSDPNLKQYFIPIDAATTSLTFPENYLDVYLTPGATIGSPDGFLSVLGESIYCFTQEKMDEICNIKLLGIDPLDVISIAIGTDGSLYVLQTGTLSIITLKFGTREYEEVVIGMIGLPSDSWSYDEDLIYTFNRQNGPHRVRIKRYRSIENLNLAILSGEVDIVTDWHADTFINYTNQQLLTPLEDVIPELFEDGVLLDNVKSAFETDGSWYYLPRSIEAQGLIISKSLLGGRSEFSDIEGFVAFLNGLDPKVLKANSRTALLETILSLGMANWVDFEAGTASFTDDSFVKLLEACNRCSPTYADSQSYDQDNSISKFTSSRQGYSLSEIGDPEKGVSPKAAFAIPTPEGSNMAISAHSFLAMLDNAPNPEGAEAFLRQAFLNSEWPVMQINFVTQRIVSRFNLYGVPIKTEEANAYFFLSNDSPDAALLTPVRDLSWAFHTTADHIVCGDVIRDIVMEEASSYFAGNITAEKATDYIQNRVSIYLAEQG